jgi:hypothetical protein
MPNARARRLAVNAKRYSERAWGFGNMAPRFALVSVLLLTAFSVLTISGL